MTGPRAAGLRARRRTSHRHIDPSATDMRSASRRAATICSSMNRLFFMGSSLSEQEPFSQVTIGPKNPGRSGDPELDRASGIRFQHST